MQIALVKVMLKQSQDQEMQELLYQDHLLHLQLLLVLVQVFHFHRHRRHQHHKHHQLIVVHCIQFHRHNLVLVVLLLQCLQELHL